MNKKIIILILLLLLSSVVGFNFGNKENKKITNLIDENHVIEIILDKLNTSSEITKISNLNLVCQNQTRYLYTFNYPNQKEENLSLAVEMIIDEDTNYYFINNISEYKNDYNNNCINNYE